MEKQYINILKNFVSSVKQLHTDVEDPICFISYSRGDIEHEVWVRDRLYRDLKEIGISVIVDEYDNSEGNVRRFVEKLPFSDCALVIGTPAYKEKSASDNWLKLETDSIIKAIATKTREKPIGVVLALREGTRDTAFPDLICGNNIHVDFVSEENYYRSICEVVLQTYRISKGDVIDIIKRCENELEYLKAHPAEEKYQARLRPCWFLCGLGLHNRTASEDALYEWLEPILKVCGYALERTKQLTTRQDRHRILDVSSLCIFYLGKRTQSRDYNDDIIFEIGYRLGTGLPVIVLRETGDFGFQLPSFLPGSCILHIPDKLPPLMENFTSRYSNLMCNDFEQINDNVFDSLVKESGDIVSSLVERVTRNTSKLTNIIKVSPVVEMEVLTDSDLQYTYISDKAKELFRGAIREGYRVTECIQKISDMMPTEQFTRFNIEQENLINKIKLNFFDKQAYLPVATIPIVFNEDDAAYLPIVTSYRTTTKTFSVHYMDVSLAVEEITDGLARYKQCILSNEALSTLTPRETVEFS